MIIFKDWIHTIGFLSIVVAVTVSVVITVMSLRLKLQNKYLIIISIILSPALLTYVTSNDRYYNHGGAFSGNDLLIMMVIFYYVVPCVILCSIIIKQTTAKKHLNPQDPSEITFANHDTSTTNNGVNRVGATPADTSLTIAPSNFGAIVNNGHHEYEKLERVDISDGINAFVMRCDFIAKKESATGDIILDVLNVKAERTVTIKIGIYADKTLVAMVSKDIDVNHGKNTVSFTQISCSVIPKKQYTAKVYLWDELNTAKLICEPIELGVGVAGGTVDNG